MRSTTNHHKNYLKVLKHQTNHELLLELMNKLPERHRIVIALRYGIPVPGLIDVDDNPQTLESIAKSLGLSCTRIFQIHNAAIGKIVRLLTVEKPENDDYKEGNEMNGMINISMTPIGDKTIPTVNARDLHARLKVKRDFLGWFENHLMFHGFVEQVDFVIIDNTQDELDKNYFISLNTARILSSTESKIVSDFFKKLIKSENSFNTLPDQVAASIQKPKDVGIIKQVIVHANDSTVQKFRYQLAPHRTNKLCRSASKVNEYPNWWAT